MRRSEGKGGQSSESCSSYAYNMKIGSIRQLEKRPRHYFHRNSRTAFDFTQAAFSRLWEGPGLGFPSQITQLGLLSWQVFLDFCIFWNVLGDSCRWLETRFLRLIPSSAQWPGILLPSCCGIQTIFFPFLDAPALPPRLDQRCSNQLRHPPSRPHHPWRISLRQRRQPKPSSSPRKQRLRNCL